MREFLSKVLRHRPRQQTAYPEPVIRSQELTKKQVVELGVRKFVDYDQITERQAMKSFVIGIDRQIPGDELQEAKRKAGRIVDLFEEVQWSDRVDYFYNVVQANAERRAGADDPQGFYKGVAYELEKLREMDPYHRAEAFFTRELTGPISAALNAIDVIALGLGDGKREEMTVSLSPRTVENSELPPTDITRALEAMEHLPTLLDLPPTSFDRETLMSLDAGVSLQETHVIGKQKFALTFRVNNPSQTDAAPGFRNIPYLTLTVNANSI